MALTEPPPTPNLEQKIKKIGPGRRQLESTDSNHLIPYAYGDLQPTS